MPHARATPPHRAPRASWERGPLGALKGLEFKALGRLCYRAGHPRMAYTLHATRGRSACSRLLAPVVLRHAPHVSSSPPSPTTGAPLAPPPPPPRLGDGVRHQAAQRSKSRAAGGTHGHAPRSGALPSIEAPKGAAAALNSALPHAGKGGPASLLGGAHGPASLPRPRYGCGQAKGPRRSLPQPTSHTVAAVGTERGGR